MNKETILTVALMLLAISTVLVPVLFLVGTFTLLNVNTVLLTVISGTLIAQCLGEVSKW